MSNALLLEAPTITVPAPRSAGFLDALAERMEREIGRLRRTVERTGSEFQRSGDELDLTALRMSHEADQALRAWCAEGLTELVQALGRLRADPAGFGRCTRCRRLIPEERLELLPTAATCATC